MPHSSIAMSRKHKHEEHANHEAWAIPYGDLITLLLAFFVVMYAISTVNEGKYRALSDSLSSAFTGSPRAPDPIQIGDKNSAAIQDKNSRLDPQGNMLGQHASLIAASSDPQHVNPGSEPAHKEQSRMTAMDAVIGKVEASMAHLIEQNMLVVRRTVSGVEIEIRTDILFPSGSATLSGTATGVLQQLAATLQSLPYPMRVEGHTDNRPISTAAFPSNWELSAARAASVVHLFMQYGIDPTRLAVIGMGEFRPVADNVTEQGRNINRRVVVVILSNGELIDNLDTDDKPADPVVTNSAAAPISSLPTPG